MGTLGDGGSTIDALRTEHGFGEGSVDFVFIDHDKAAYLPDLERILGERWLHPGSIVVADNVRFPGAPEYRAYLEAQAGQDLAHDRARDPRRVPVADQGPRARIGVPGRAGLRAESPALGPGCGQ